ncbi:MAG: diacylglycerol kinase family protein [Clostridia bacterium]|nr:diacylglycerol kinase family protein [Clostridia bacterium]
MLFIKSFFHAFRGFFDAVKTERNLRFHLVAAFYVLLISPFFLQSKTDWTVVILLICTVISLELINTAIEKLCDLITTDYNVNIKFIKDVASGAVLITAIGAVVIACLLFLRYEGFILLFDFSKQNLWYPILLIILAPISFLFIKGKKGN